MCNKMLEYKKKKEGERWLIVNTQEKYDENYQ
jgi:hypothetical protein